MSRLLSGSDMLAVLNACRASPCGNSSRYHRLASTVELNVAFHREQMGKNQEIFDCGLIFTVQSGILLYDLHVLRSC
jgi:hypothetical protein